jgi:hypothetical protein
MSLNRATRGARDDDATLSHTDPGADGREKEREALLAEGTFEARRYPDVVPHPETAGELHVATCPPRMATEGFRSREFEQGGHALDGDAPLHAAVAPLRHVAPGSDAVRQ